MSDEKSLFKYLLDDIEHWKKDPVWKYSYKKFFHYKRMQRGKQWKYDSFEKWKINLEKHASRALKYQEMWENAYDE